MTEPMSKPRPEPKHPIRFICLNSLNNISTPLYANIHRVDPDGFCKSKTYKYNRVHSNVTPSSAVRIFLAMMKLAERKIENDRMQNS